MTRVDDVEPNIAGYEFNDTNRCDLHHLERGSDSEFRCYETSTQMCNQFQAWQACLDGLYVD